MDTQELLAKAAALEAPMPQAQTRMGVHEKLLGVAWIAAGLGIVALYIGVPLAAVANAIEQVSLADCLFAVSMVIGLVFIIVDILKQTAKE